MTVYADNAATTKMSQTALNAMLPAMEENFGNPSSLHSVGQRAAELLMKSRETVARCLNCSVWPVPVQGGNAETVLRPEKVLSKCFRTGVRLPSAPPK